MDRDVMTADIVIVGAGPAGLSAAIRLMQQAKAAGMDLSVIVVEKGSEVGAHILSGAVFDPKALTELIPDWRQAGAPVTVPVSSERFLFLSQNGTVPVPHFLLPPVMKNHGHYVIRLGLMCRWLAEQAEVLGVDIFPGFAAADILYDDTGRVCGIRTGDMGRTPDGAEGPNFEPGCDIRATYTFFAEGCRGSLGQKLIERFNLSQDPTPYSIGFKEVWEVDPRHHRPGHVQHTAGWPLDLETYGGSFIYHGSDHQVAVGFVIGLNYQNPYMDPFAEFQRFKTHPAIRPLFEGGRRLSYGARALNTGGLQALPKMTVPGGVLIGCDAGTLNVPKIKGSHTAMKTGILAAEAAFSGLSQPNPPAELTSYTDAFNASWVYQELYQARNFKPLMSRCLVQGTLLSGIDQIILRGRAPWTLRHTRADHETLIPKDQATRMTYPKPDGRVTFDRLSSVFLSNTSHTEAQPVHLRLTNPETPVQHNLPLYDAPEQRYCPAGVYEIIPSGPDQTVSTLQINAQNCIHCKTCDIKDPTQNITWVTPEGGGGPNYSNM